MILALSSFANCEFNRRPKKAANKIFRRDFAPVTNEYSSKVLTS